MEELKIGDKAKDFVLKDHNDKEIKLSNFAGKKVLLSFHPLAWTEICAKQMQSLEKNMGVFDSLNTVAFGLSVDSVPCKKAWAESLGVEKTSLLSDFWPHGEVAKLYGILNEKKGISQRTNIILNEEQNITFFKIYEIKTLPDINEILDFIRNM